MLGRGEIRILIENLLGGSASLLEGARVETRAQHREIRQATLTRAEKIAGTPHSQVGLGQDKAVGGRLHHLQALLAHRRGVVGKEKAIGSAATATDPAPE